MLPGPRRQINSHRNYCGVRLVMRRPGVVCRVVLTAQAGPLLGLGDFVARARPASTVPPGSFLRCLLSEKRGSLSLPRSTGIPTTGAFYSGGSVSLRVSHSRCLSLSLSLYPVGLSVCPLSSRPS